MSDLIIVCDTPDCPRSGQEINRLEMVDGKFIEAVIEFWRPEDEEDRCPECGNFGRLEDV